MSSRRKVFWVIMAVFTIGLMGRATAQPVFENNTPVGFSPSDSTTTSFFVTDKEITLLVDLNEAANSTYPVVANFQRVEKSVPAFGSAATSTSAAYMDQAIAVDDNGVIHRAWVQNRGFTTAGDATTTPVYGVVYSKSIDGGESFSDTVSVSGTLRFDMLTPNVAMTGGFSTVDIVVNSMGNPRVVYAMDNSADGRHGGFNATTNQLHAIAGGTQSRQYNNILFNYSNDGGNTWLPANDAVVVNDVVTAGNGSGKKTAFPRMAIASTDDIFVTYQRSSTNAATGIDVMLAKVDEDSLKSGSAQAVRIGPMGTVGSRGGVRLTPADDTAADLSPDIAIGDNDVLHVVYFSPGSDEVRHKALPAEDWADVSSFGWDSGSDGATVGSFDDDFADNIGLDYGANNSTAAIAEGRVHLFPTVVVDAARTPDRVYALWKHTSAALGATTIGNHENIAYNTLTYDGSVGGSAGWGSTQFAFPTGTDGSLFQYNGNPLFQNSSRYQIQNDGWAYVDKVTAVVDDRVPNSRGDLHIVFSGGGSGNAGPTTAALGSGGIATNLYYSRFNNNEWELPQVIATARDAITGTATEVHDSGINSSHRALFAPDIAMRSDDDNVYLSFVGGSPRMAALPPRNRPNRTAGDLMGISNPGRGYATLRHGDIQPVPYFKVIGRVVSFEDISTPVGGFQYQMSYDPINPQTALAFKNLVTVTAGDNQDGSGIGGNTPGTTQAPGGFLTGQWRRIGNFTLGVTTLNPGEAGAVFKGAVSQSQATNDNGVWEGRVDDDGSSGFAEWGDDGDKDGLLVKLNVLGSDSATNMFVIAHSSASKMAGTAAANDSSSQSIIVDTTTAVSTTLQASGFVKGITMNGQVAASAVTAPMGSYFWMGANINIRTTNVAPVVNVSEPNDGTIATGAFNNETATIRYSLYDADDDVSAPVGGLDTGLQMELYAYPDNGLNSVLDIRTFATMIADEWDVSTVNAAGTDDFVEGSGATNVQTYTWDDPGAALRNVGFASLTKTLDGNYFIYIVADDQVNPPVYAVSSGALKVRHVPLVKSIAPVSTDTVDTGEFTNLNITNPYNIKFTVKDYDDDAQLRLFASVTSGLNATNATISGTFPSQTLELEGAFPIQLSDTLRTDQDVDFEFDVTAQGASGDSIITQGNYFLYVVVADDDTFTVGQSDLTLAVRHSPAFEFTNPLVGEIDKVNTTQQFNYSIEWQRGRSDQDLDGNAKISLYYIGTDPQDRSFAGKDSAALIDSGAVLIAGGMREDEEGAADQYIWNFRNPPSELPRTYRPVVPTGTDPVAGSGAVHAYQPVVGNSTDTVWVYAVLSDSLGNTKVESGGAVLLLGSQETPGSQAPKVTMMTPPSGGLDLVNGDVVRLEWDAFLIDDNTGTDDAYLRLYAAPAGKYTTLTELESHNIADSQAPGEQADVILINSITGADTNATQITTLRESGANYFLWDTKTSSFGISGTPIEYDIFIAGSVDPDFNDTVWLGGGTNAVIDSIASGIGSQSQRAVLSKSPGTLRVTGTDPFFSLELSPGGTTASSGDTLDFEVLINSQGTGVNIISVHLDVPRQRFTLVDQDDGAEGMQPFADSTGAFRGSSTIAQNDTTAGNAEFLKLNFVESIILPQQIGASSSPFDSSQVAATFQLIANRYQGGAPLDTLIQWSTESGRQSALYNGITPAATSTRNARVKLVPRALLTATVPLEGRPSSYADTVDVHLRQIGSVHDIDDQVYIQANDVTPTYVGATAETGETAIPAEEEGAAAKVLAIAETESTLEDSVQVVSNNYGMFTLTEIPAGVYELTVKVDGYVSGRSDTLRMFDGLSVTLTPTFGSDLLGNLAPATPLPALRGGDATGDNQIDLADANRIFALWNQTPADSGYVRDADINADGVINSLDLGFVSTNFGNDGYGAPPVFKKNIRAGDNSTAVVEFEGIEEVESWWPGKVFEVSARISGMNDVAAYGFSISYDPERVKPLASAQAVTEGDVFKLNPKGSLFYQRTLPGRIDVTGGRIGKDWSASGSAELATVRFMTLGEEPGIIEIVSGELMNSDFSGVTMQVKKLQALPQVAALQQNYPNPFNPSTEIRFAIPTARDVQLKVYNQLGQTVRTLVDRRMKAGSYSMNWDGTTEAGHQVSSGVYFYSLEAGDFSQIRKMTLLK